MAKTPNAQPKCATMQLLQTHPRKTKKAAMSPVRTDAKADVRVVVVGVDVVVALSAAHALTRTASRWTAHKRLWVLLNLTVTRTPARRAQKRPKPAPTVAPLAKAVKNAPATAMAVNVDRARTVAIARTAPVMSLATVMMQRPTSRTQLQRWHLLWLRQLRMQPHPLP